MINSFSSISSPRPDPQMLSKSSGMILSACSAAETQRAGMHLLSLEKKAKRTFYSPLGLDHHPPYSGG
jgi:hypothetical protein